MALAATDLPHTLDTVPWGELAYKKGGVHGAWKKLRFWYLLVFLASKVHGGSFARHLLGYWAEYDRR